MTTTCTFKSDHVYLFPQHRQNQEAQDLEILVEWQPRDKDVCQVAHGCKDCNDNPFRQQCLKRIGLGGLQCLECLIRRQEQSRDNAKIHEIMFLQEDVVNKHREHGMS